MTTFKNVGNKARINSNAPYLCVGDFCPRLNRLLEHRLMLEGRQLDLNMKITAREAATTLGLVAAIATLLSYALYVIFSY